MCARAALAKSLVLLGAVVLAGACTERSSNLAMTAPSFSASASSLPHINNTALPIPVAIAADFSAYDCSNVDLTVMPADEQIVIPKQPVLGGTGGNPFIWVQFIGADGAALSDEIFVGRCVQGAGWHVTQSAVTTASAVATFTVESCENSPGPFISFTSGVTMAGVSARIIFRNNDNPVGGPHEADVTRDIAVIPAGLSLTFPKQPVLGGVGGNPWIFAAFTGADGKALGAATLLGRCVQLNNAVS